MVALTIKTTLGDSLEKVTGVKGQSLPTSISGLSPRSPVLIGLDKLPIKAPHHSIIGDRGRGDSPNGSDGVVPYRSAHLDSAQSEKIIPYGHGGYQSPEAIDEILRILRLHVGLKAEPAHKVAAAQQLYVTLILLTALGNSFVAEPPKVSPDEALKPLPQGNARFSLASPSRISFFKSTRRLVTSVGKETDEEMLARSTAGGSKKFFRQHVAVNQTHS
jgi:hypothetical protein